MPDRRVKTIPPVADNTGFDFMLHQTSRADCHAPTTGARNHSDLRENLVTHTEILYRIRLRKNGLSGIIYI